MYPPDYYPPGYLPQEPYRKNAFNVYWMGRKVDGATAMSFVDL